MGDGEGVRRALFFFLFFFFSFFFSSFFAAAAAAFAAAAALAAAALAASAALAAAAGFSNKILDLAQRALGLLLPGPHARHARPRDEVGRGRVGLREARAARAPGRGRGV